MNIPQGYSVHNHTQFYGENISLFKFKYTTKFFMSVHFHISTHQPLSNINSGGILEICMYYATKLGV